LHICNRLRCCTGPLTVTQVSCTDHFCPSSATIGDQHPPNNNNLRMSVLQLSQDTKFREIVKIYRRVKTLHPIASQLFESPELERLFRSNLTHDLSVIRQRSQSLSDGEITAVQKAFEVLMGEKADRNAAIEIYMDEILGLKAIAGADRAKTLSQATLTRGYILNRTSSIKPLYGTPRALPY